MATSLPNRLRLVDVGEVSGQPEPVTRVNGSVSDGRSNRWTWPAVVVSCW